MPIIPIYLFFLTGFLIILTVFLITLIVLFFVKEIKKSQIARGMKLALFSITLPRNEKENKEQNKPEDFIKIAEQFYSSLSGISKKSGWEATLLGNTYLVFEIALQKVGEAILFYFACPKELSQMMEKQILAFWPQAQVSPAEDYNIFNVRGKSAGSEATLSKNSLLPLKSFEEFKVDPLSSATGVLTKLDKKEEGAAIQIIFRPSSKNLKAKTAKVIKMMQKGKKFEDALRGKESSATEMIIGDISGSKKEKTEKEKYFEQKINPANEEIISVISKKSMQTLFDVNLRIIASAKDETRAKNIVEHVKSAFDQFGSPMLNSLKFKMLGGSALKTLFYNFSFRIFNNKNSMLLSARELAGIIHFPGSELATPNLKWVKAKQAPPPSELPEEGLIIGKSIFRGDEKQVKIKENDRLRHFYIIGQTGTGKSVLLEEMVRQDIEAGNGVALIDPHGDMAEKVLSLIPASRAEDVVYFNPSDIELPLGLNMLEFDPKYPESKTFVVNELLEIFEKLYGLKEHGFGGPMFEQYMRNSILLLMEDPDSGNTLIEIPKVLSDPDFRKYKLSKCKNIVVKNFWELEAEKAGGEAALANIVPYITSKMNVFIANDMVRPIIAQQKSAFNLRQIMDEGKILIVNLAKGRLGDTNSFLLGMIIVGKLLLAAFSRTDISESQRKNFFLYIDEFQNVTTKTISSVLAEARKYKLAMTFGHQFIGQLDEETKKAVFGNVGSMMAFRVGPDDAKYLVTQFEPVFDENDLVNLDNYNSALRLLIDGQTTRAFNIVTYPPQEGDKKIGDLIKELSRRKYGRNKDMVEAELDKRLKKSYTI